VPPIVSDLLAQKTGTDPKFWGGLQEGLLSPGFGKLYGFNASLEERCETCGGFIANGIPYQLAVHQAIRKAATKNFLASGAYCF
jgi:hypothetical protein